MYDATFCGENYELVVKEFDNPTDLIHWVRCHECDSWDGLPILHQDGGMVHIPFIYAHMDNGLVFPFYKLQLSAHDMRLLRQAGLSYLEHV